MKSQGTALSRFLFPILLTVFIDNFGLAIVYPIFTPLFLKPGIGILGTDFSLMQRTFFLGLLIASFPLAQFFGAPFWGELSDRLGRKKILLGTISGGIIGYILTGLGIHFRELSLLWVGRALTGFFAGNLTLCLAAIADITENKAARSRNFGWVGTVGGLGFVLAIFAGGSLSNPNLEGFFHPEIPFFITALFGLVNLGLMYKFFKESHKIKPPDKFEFFKGIRNISSAIQTKSIRIIYLAYFLFMVAWVCSMQFLSTYLIDVFKVTENTITIAFVFIGITWSLSNFLINPFLSRIFSSSKTFLFALSFLCIFLFLLAIPHEPLFLFLTHFFLATLCAAITWTNGLATLSLNVSSKIQGRILGVNQSMIAVASIVGPIVGGTIAGFDIHILYIFTAACTLLATNLLFFRKSAIKKM